MPDSAHKLINSGYKQVVELKSAAGDVCYHLTLIGQHYPEYLIVELPRQYAWQDVLPTLRNQHKLVMRTISQSGEIIAGQVNLVHATQFPNKLLFLSYPEQVESKPLRKAPRMTIDVAAQLQLQNATMSTINGQLRDMSVNGFGFNCEGLLPCFEGELLNQDLTLSIQFSDDKATNFVARVKSIDEGGPKQWKIGLECQIDEKDRSDLRQQLLLNSRPMVELQKIDQIEGSHTDKTLQGQSDSVQFSTN